MAWEWSHTQEAYETARKNLGKKARRWLEVCWAEWCATTFKREETLEGPEFDGEEYERELDIVKEEKPDKEDLAQRIWDRMEQLRTCTNGGHEAYACPFGCHLVSFGD